MKCVEGKEIECGGEGGGGRSLGAEREKKKRAPSVFFAYGAVLSPIAAPSSSFPPRPRRGAHSTMLNT